MKNKNETASNERLRQSFQVHNLIANTFMENPNKCKFVGHKDNNFKNNHVNNLYFTNQITKLKNK